MKFLWPLLTILLLIQISAPAAAEPVGNAPLLVPRPLPKPSSASRGGNARPSLQPRPPMMPQPQTRITAGMTPNPSPAATQGRTNLAGQEQAVILGIRRGAAPNAAPDATHKASAQPAKPDAQATGIRDGEVRILRSGVRLAVPNNP